MALTIMNVCLACVIFRYDFGVGGFKRMGGPCRLRLPRRFAPRNDSRERGGASSQ